MAYASIASIALAAGPSHTPDDAQANIVEPSSRNIVELPEDVLERVFGSLNLRDLASCGATCKSLRLLMQRCLAQVEEVDTALAKRFHSSHSHLLLRWLAAHCSRPQAVSLVFLPLYHTRHLGLLDAWLPFSYTATALTSLTLLNVHVNDLALSAVAERAPRLRRLLLGCEQGGVYGCLVGDRGMRSVAAHCPELQRLALLRCRVGDAGLQAFVRHGQRLTHLTLHLCEQVTRSGVISLAEGCRGLVAVDVLLCEVGINAATCLDFAAMFVLAANCDQLEELRVSEEVTRNSVLDDACVSLLVDGCPKLRALEFVQVELTDLTLLKLSLSCTGLRSLTLEKAYATDTGLRRVARCCRLLEDVRVGGRNEHIWVLPEDPFLPGPSLLALQEFGTHSKHLTSLHFSGLCHTSVLPDGPLVCDEVAGRLRHLGLPWLKLDHMRFRQRLAGVLGGCSGLASLDIRGFQDSLLQVFDSLPRVVCASLTRLQLSNTLASDATLHSIAHRLRGLRRLHLGGCRHVGDAGLLQLQRLTGLEHLDLHNVPLVSDHGVAVLACSSPSLSHLNIGCSPGSHRTLTVDGCRALYQVSRDLNTQLHVDLGLPTPASPFQHRSLQRMGVLPGSHGE